MNKKGYLLIETVIAIAVFAIVVIGFMQGLQVGILGTYRVDVSNTALNLAQSQMEYIKSLPYCDGCDTYDKVPDIDIPEGFDSDDIEVAVCDRCDANCIYESPPPEPCASGLQKVTVNVSYDGKSVVLQGYKTDR